MHDSLDNLEYLIIVPVFNEGLILERSLELIFSYLRYQWSKRDSVWKIVVADNCSDDNTKFIVEKLLLKYQNNLNYVYIDKPGKGNAIRSVVGRYPAQNFLCIDADIPVDPNYFDSFFNLLENKKADIVVGKRCGKRPWLRRIVTKLMRLYNQILFGLNLRDPQCGIKAFNNQAADFLVAKCREDGYFLDTEFLVKAKNQNFRIVELEVNWVEQRYEDRQSKTNIIRDSIRAFKALNKLAIKQWFKIDK